MSITVDDLLKIGGFAQSSVVAGLGGLHKQITYAGSMETPDIKPWLIRGQLMVTTGYSIRGEPDKITTLIQDLYDMECSALAIKTRFTGPIPPAALELADRLKIPVIEVPDPINFVDLVPPAIQAIYAGHTRLVDFSQDIHARFQELDASGGGMQNVCNMLSNLLLASVQITSANFFPLYSARKGDIDPHYAFPHFIRQARVQLDSFATSEKTRMYLQMTQMGMNYIVHKVMLKERTLAYVFVCSGDLPNELSNIVVDHAAAVIALEYSKQENVRESRRIVAGNLLTDLLAGSIRSEEEALDRSADLGWPIPPFSLMVFDVNDFESITRAQSEPQLQQTKRDIYDVIAQQLFPTIQYPPIVLKSDSFTCLISGTYGKDQLGASCDGVLRGVQSRLSIQMTGGVSTIVPSYRDMVQAHADARDAIRISRIDHDPRHRRFAEDVRMEQALLHGPSNPYLTRHIQQTVTKLERYDRENESQLLTTLEVLVDCLGARTQAAERLFMHRNTLTYRIRRIEQVVGCNLSDSRQLLSLALALKAHRYSTQTSP